MRTIGIIIQIRMSILITQSPTIFLNFFFSCVLYFISINSWKIIICFGSTINAYSPISRELWFLP